MGKVSEELNRELMEDMRQEMLAEAYEDERYERLMRTDDDYWWDRILDVAETESFIDTIEQVKHLCINYDRDYRDEINALLDFYR